MLAIGMPSEEFWHGDPRLAVAYRKAAKIQWDNRYLAEWRAGVYVHEALVAASRFYREWSKGVDYQYPTTPMFGDYATEENRRENQARETMNENMRKFLAMMNAANAKFTSERDSAPEE